METITIVGVTQGYYGSVAMESDGTVTYSPADDWYGTDWFTYTASDGTDMDTATVTVTVNPVNDQPVADALNVSTDEDTLVVVTLSGSDVEGPSVTFYIDAPPSHGTLGELSENTVTYYPDGNFSGADSFTYQTYDGQRLSEPATVSITVNEVADSAGVTITATGGANLVSEPGWLVGQEAQSDTYTVVLNTAPTADVTITLDADEQLVVSPLLLTFTSSDWSIAQTVTVDAVADQIAEGEHTGVIAHTATSADPVYNGVSIANVNVTVTEYDFAGIVMFPPDPPLDLNEEGPTSADYTVELTSKPTANVTVTLAPGSQVTLSASTLVFGPENWDVGQTVTVTAVDDATVDGYDEAVIVLTASSSDAGYNGLTADGSAMVIDSDGPSALRDALTTDEDTPATFDVRVNDIDPAGSGLSVIEPVLADHGSVALNQNGTLTYTPDADWYGYDILVYVVEDGLGRRDAGSVTVTVVPVNDPPTVTNPGPQTFAEDDWVSFQIVATDLEETAFVYTVPEPMPGGNSLPPGLVLDATIGRIRGWLDPRASGGYTTDVIVDDLNGGVTTVTFDWTITDTNHPPFLEYGGYQYSYVGEAWASGGDAVDIDGDDARITEATGLPPGIEFNPENSQVFGILTTAGTYGVSITVSDGHGGTDTEAFTWFVFRNDQPPPPLALAGWHVGAPSGIDFTLTDPATPLLGTVSLQNPGDPQALLEVTLSVEPAGRGTISPTSVMLRDGESAVFEVTPKAISQEVHDAYVSVGVAGGETGRAYFTNVGMVLPRHVRGPDTPEGMKDRISIGTGNWGSYNAVIGVYPNLLGLYNTEVGFVRPEEDDKYGAAAADASDAQRLSVAVRAAVKLSGTVQTAPTPDGRGGNADNLRLRATVSDPNGAGSVQRTMANATTVAAIPVAIYATGAVVPDPLEILVQNLKERKDVRSFWGVDYTMTPVPDGGPLDWVAVSEVVEVLWKDGLFLGRPDISGGWDWATEMDLDSVGLAVRLPKTPVPLPEPQEGLRMLRTRLAALIGKKGGREIDAQAYVFRSWRTGSGPYTGFYVTFSSFELKFSTDERLPALIIQKTGKAFGGGPYAGFVEKQAFGVKVAKV